MRTKFYHVMQPKRLRATFAIDVCDKQTLLELLNKLLVTREMASYEGKFGVALVNPKDQHFVKKIGRHQALLKQEDVNYHLMAVEPRGQGTMYQFAVEFKTRSPIKVNFLTKADSQLVHIAFVDVLAIRRR